MMLRIQLNTYEGAKPSLSNAASPSATKNSNNNNNSGRDSESEFCSPEKSLECFLAIVGTSLGLLVIVLLISSWIHYSHAVKLQEKQHRRKQMSDTVASSSSAGYPRQIEEGSRVNNPQQIFEDVVQSGPGRPGPGESAGGQLMDFKEFLSREATPTTTAPEDDDDANKNCDGGEVKV